MCGLVGIAGDLEYKDEGTMKRLLIFDYFRGPDSTGIAAVRNNNDVKLTKIASHPVDLFDSKSFDKALSGYQSKVFLGHNRAATIGKVNSANAHPFQYGHIVGAHNGTLDKKSWDRLNEVLGYETDVDSAAIFACFEQIGAEETIKLLEEGRDSRTGAWALSWVDLKDNSLNFIRNRHRPLWLAYSEGFKKVLWASEHEIIEAAVAMCNTDYELYESKDGYRFWELATDWWYRFDLDKLAKGAKSKPIARVKEVKGREPAPAVVGTPPFVPAQRSTWNGGTTSSSTTQSSWEGPKKTVPPVQDFVATGSAPFSSFLTKERFNELAKNGCSWCSTDVDYEEVGVTVMPHHQAVLCPSCTNDTNASRLYLSPAHYNHVMSSLTEEDSKDERLTC